MENKIDEFYKDIKELGGRIDKGFLNLQKFLEYFSKSSEDQKIPIDKANIPPV